jgi:glutamine phosphoribosylpyrophosphate amidotransferase
VALPVHSRSTQCSPMSDATGRWVISFNGEIYNHCALRSELESLGCVFQTSSDTEVLINVLAHWGEAGLRELRGIYAFAVGFPASTAMACPRSLRHQTALCFREAGHALVCVSGVRLSRLCAGRSTTRCGRAHRIPICGVTYRSHFPGGQGSARFLPVMCNGFARDGR